MSWEERKKRKNFFIKPCRYRELNESEWNPLRPRCRNAASRVALCGIIIIVLCSRLTLPSGSSRGANSIEIKKKMKPNGTPLERSQQQFRPRALCYHALKDNKITACASILFSKNKCLYARATIFLNLHTCYWKQLRNA